MFTGTWIQDLRVSAVLLTMIALCFAAVPMTGAAGGTVMTDADRAARFEELQRRKTVVEEELRQLRARPEGMTQSVISRREMENQPTRTQKESLESVPGVAVKAGGTSRDQELTIRGISP